MAVCSLEIRSRSPYEGGAEFGETGSYERIEGLAHFAVDPLLPGNAGIVDLDRAARDADGRVRFSADISILQPADPQRGNRRLLLDVLNRGNRLAPRFFNRARPQAVLSEGIEPGDGFLFRHGWTLAWCGWQWDVRRGSALLGLTAPQALAADGFPIQGQVMVQFQPNQQLCDRLLADRIHEPYPAADIEQADAQLAVRDWLHGARQAIPRGRWRFARDEGGNPVPDEARVWLEGGFAAGKVYEVIYRTRACPVVGAGLLATRDFVSFLRYGDAAFGHGDAASGNPCAGRLTYAFGYGASQSGRFLRHLLYLGLNVDEQDRQVFDGLNIHIAGGRRGQFNQRFGQPSDSASHGLGHRFPFTDDDQTDPLIGKTDGGETDGGETDGLLRRQRARGGVPKIIATNTSAEYWRGDASLIHTDLSGTADQEPADNVRVYLFAGTQHGPGALPLASVNPLDGSRGAHSFNVVDYSPLARAALDNLDRWVTAGVEPPPSRFPRLADGTATAPVQAAAFVGAIPGVTVPAADRPLNMRRLDFGPESDQGIGRYPPVSGEQYPSFVSAVDADGNETGGIRLPDLTVPLATYTGWNPRHPDIGGAGQILNMLGSTLPFPASAEARLSSGDPRRSIAERYQDRDDYLSRVEAAAAGLVAERLVLAEDQALVVRLAGRRYDAFAPAEAPLAVRPR